MDFNKKIILLLFCSISIIIGCKDETILPEAPVSFNYFPTAKDKWIIYDVDSTYYNDFDMSVNQYLFQIMERIDSTFIDGQGNPTQLIFRYRRDADSSDWSFINVYTQTLTNSNAQRNEDNIRYVKLAFPISPSKIWDRNAYNTIGKEEYEYSDIHLKKIIGRITFDSTLNVSLADKLSNNIHDYIVEENYATKVGLVFKKYVDVDKNIGGSYYKGVVYYQTVNSFGN